METPLATEVERYELHDTKPPRIMIVLAVTACGSPTRHIEVQCPFKHPDGDISIDQFAGTTVDGGRKWPMTAVFIREAGDWVFQSVRLSQPTRVRKGKLRLMNWADDVPDEERAQGVHWRVESKYKARLWWEGGPFTNPSCET